MSFSLNDIRSNLIFGAARQTLFKVSISNPVTKDADSIIQFMVQASQIPASNLGTINIPYFGRTLKLAGDRTYDPWSVTVINDEDFKVRNALETWSNSINGLVSNQRSGPGNFKSTATVVQYSKTNVPIREYTFDGIFPAEISTIDLDWSAVDAYQTFNVTFQYDWWTANGRGKTGNPGQ